MGTRWKSLSEEEKKPYEERHQRDKEAYLQVVGQERREHEAMKLFEEEKMQKTAMDLLEQYLHFKQVYRTPQKLLSLKYICNDRECIFMKESEKENKKTR